MQHAWLIDVLADLRGFARKEGYDRLAEQIDDTLIVAAGEIARTGGSVGPPLPGLCGTDAPAGRGRH